jgi:hypothetical protein
VIFLQNSTELNKKAAQSTNNMIKIKNVIIFAEGNEKECVKCKTLFIMDHPCISH